MDNSRKITHTMIETALTKALRDIEENSNRGIRNLVDLGTHLAKGRFQKEFFRISQQMLDNENSAYYAMTNNIVRNVNHQIIKNFGVNLGYNSWTYGAEKIRECQKTYGHNIPWTIIFDFRQDMPTMLSSKEISGVLSCGESLGIYCGMFLVNREKAYLKTLLAVLATHQESAYFLFVPPEIITEEIAREIVNAGNIIIVLEMNTAGESPGCRNAAAILLNRKCLYGIYSMYGDDNVEYVMSDCYLRQIEEFYCTFAFLIREDLKDAQNKERFSQFMETAKSANEYIFFLIDFYEDLANVDKIISGEDCFLAIKTNDGIAVTLTETLSAELNIRTNSLQTILKETMFKTQSI